MSSDQTTPAEWARLHARAVAQGQELQRRAETAERACRTLGGIIDRWGLLIIAATGSQDLVDETGDGDWQVIEERLAALAEAITTGARP